MEDSALFNKEILQQQEEYSKGGLSTGDYEVAFRTCCFTAG